MIKIMVLSEDLPIGGQEIMCSKLVSELAKFSELSFVIVGNRSFISLFNNEFQKQELKLKVRKASGSFGLLYFNDYINIRSVIKENNPDIVLVSQGTIELGIKILIVSSFLRIPAISYIPLVIDLVKTGSSFLPRLRNIFNKILYKIPDAFITISNVVRNDLYAQLNQKSKSITVVNNWISLKDREFCDNTKRALSWVKSAKESGRFVIGIVGRIEFKHKQQDKFIRFFSKSNLSSSASIAFIGEGSDQENLTDIILKENNIHCFGPRKATGISAIFSEIDLLVICSSFEGVPLVMLEALSCGLKVASFYYESISDYTDVVSIAEYQNFDSLISNIEDIINESHSEKYKNLKYTLPNSEQISAVHEQIVRLVNRDD